MNGFEPQMSESATYDMTPDGTIFQIVSRTHENQGKTHVLNYVVMFLYMLFIIYNLFESLFYKLQTLL
jgi:hypothetical protein